MVPRIEVSCGALGAQALDLQRGDAIAASTHQICSIPLADPVSLTRFGGSEKKAVTPAWVLPSVVLK